MKKKSPPVVLYRETNSTFSRTKEDADMGTGAMLDCIVHRFLGDGKKLG
jgi:hypothetical protein